MGRPLKKSLFGNPSASGKQLVLSEAWISGAASASAPNSVWIVKQISPRRFKVSDGTVEGEVYLQDGPVTAAGQARIAVAVFGGGTEYARSINSKVVKTYTGGVYRWNKDVAASQAGEANLPMA